MKKTLKRILACTLVVMMLSQYLPEIYASASGTDVPEIGSQLNLAESANNQLTAFDGTVAGSTTHIQYLDLGTASVEGNTWYYSGTFNYSSIGHCKGLHLVFGECTYGGNTKTLVVTARPLMSNNTVTGTQVLLGVGLTDYLQAGDGKGVKYATGVDYQFTIKVSNNKLYFWIDDTLFFENYDLTAMGDGVTNITPTKFGTYSNGSKGTLSNIRLWDDVQTKQTHAVNVYPIGNQVNLAQAAKNVVTTFDNASATENIQYIDLSEVEVEGNTWYYTGRFRYQALSGGTGGVHFYFGACDYYDGTTQKNGSLVVTARPVVSAGTVTGTQVLLGVNNTDYIVAGNGQGQKYSTGIDYTFSIKVSNGKMSFWIDNTQFFADYDLTAMSNTRFSQISNITPTKFGFYANGTKGKIFDVKIWDEVQENLVKDLPTIPTQFNASNAKQTLPFGKLTATGEAWYFSGKYKYTSLLTNGNQSGMWVVLGTGTKKSDGTTAEISVSARPSYNTSTGTMNKSTAVMKVGNTLVKAGGGPLLNLNQEYQFTVKVDGTKVKFWIDNTLVWDVDLSDSAQVTVNNVDYSVTSIAPLFGISREAADGAISNLQVWGGLEVQNPPTMGGGDVNLAEGRDLPSDFTAGTNVTFDLGKVEMQTEPTSWYYSGTFNYEQLSGGYGGLTFVFGEGVYELNGASAIATLAVTARPVVANGAVKETQVVVWTTKPGGEGVQLTTSPVKFETGRDYTFTIQVVDNKVSFWIDKILFVNDCDLTQPSLSANKVVVNDIKPKFGFYPDGTSGTIFDIKIWGDIASVGPAVRPEAIANQASECEQITTFMSSIYSYYDAEKVKVDGNSWYYSGSFEYTKIPKWGGITFIFGEGTYTTPASDTQAAVTGTRELSVTARSADFTGDVRNVQRILWVDTTAVEAAGVSGVTLETGKTYNWTIEVEDGYLTFWIDEQLIYNELDLSVYGITNVQPKFGIRSEGASGTVSDVEIWDGVTAEVLPTFGETETNESILKNVRISANTGRMEYEGLQFTDAGVSYYSADVKQSAGETIRLLIAKVGQATVEVYYDGKEAYLVKHSNGKDTEIASATVNIDISGACNYKVKNNAGSFSVWVNDVPVFSKIVIADATATAGFAANGAIGEICNIHLWGDVMATGGIVYQQFSDISSYRSGTYTYPETNGYVFGGWYQNSDEKAPIPENTTSGAAYAKMVPETVLSIKTQILKDTVYTDATTSLRFVTAVDSLEYKDICITVNSEGKTRTYSGMDVYKRITVGEGEAQNFESPKKVFGKEASYFFTVNIKNVKAFNQSWIAVPGWTTLDGTKVTGVALDVTVNDTFAKRVITEKVGLNGSTVLQVNSSTEMMSYIIKTKDNQVIVIDGGSEKDAEYLVWLLKNRYQVSAVDAWYITHEDSAHYGALEKILTEKSITVKNIYYNFLTKSTTDFAKLMRANSSAKEIGQVTHTYGTVKVQVVNDCEAYASEYDQNPGNADKATMLLLVEFGGAENTGILFLGDLTSDTESHVLKQAEQGNIDLSGKIVQVAKHGTGGCSNAFYEHLKPSACLWPTTTWTSWDNGDKLRNFLEVKDVLKHYAAVHGVYEFY